MRTYKKIMFVGMTVIVMQAVMSIKQANAQDPKFVLLDTNQDGQISLREAAGDTTVLQNFNIIDLNEDGYLSQGELDLISYISHSP